MATCYFKIHRWRVSYFRAPSPPGLVDPAGVGRLAVSAGWLGPVERASLGITMRAFRDPEGSKRVGLIGEIPDMAVFQEFMQSEAAAEAMKHDGVHPETLLVLSER